MINSIIDKVEEIAINLKELRTQMVFVGGSIIPFYITDELVDEVRPTKDIDCIISLLSYGKYSDLEEKIRDLGFENFKDEDNPKMCRWIFNDILVDIMPTDEKILGFSNQWYEEGFKHIKTVTLPKETEISILTLPYFLATKIEAFHHRGDSKENYGISHDLEDIVNVLDGQKDIKELISAPDKVKNYLKAEFKKLLDNDHFMQILNGNVGFANTGIVNNRVTRIIEMLDYFINELHSK